jgi:DNA-binding response OmpR family regulator
MSLFTDRKNAGTGFAAVWPMRVLVIEDNAELRDYLRLALESQQYEVLTARNGQEALGYLNGHAVDVVLTDLFMPEMDGIEVIAALRRQFPGVRIVAMSGRPGGDYLAVARELGVANTLRKPFEIDELLAALKEGKG